MKLKQFRRCHCRDRRALWIYISDNRWCRVERQWRQEWRNVTNPNGRPTSALVQTDSVRDNSNREQSNVYSLTGCCPRLANVKINFCGQGNLSREILSGAVEGLKWWSMTVQGPQHWRIAQSRPQPETLYHSVICLYIHFRLSLDGRCDSVMSLHDHNPWMYVKTVFSCATLEITGLRQSESLK